VDQGGQGSLALSLSNVVMTGYHGAYAALQGHGGSWTCITPTKSDALWALQNYGSPSFFVNSVSVLVTSFPFVNGYVASTSSNVDSTECPFGAWAPICVGSTQSTIDITQVTFFPTTGSDAQGPISVGAVIDSPNTVMLSDGSQLTLPAGTLTWDAPGSFTLTCTTVDECAGALRFTANFAPPSDGTSVQVVPVGVQITLVDDANFSASVTASDVTVNDYDGVFQVTGLNGTGTVFLSGLQGQYGQKVTTFGNETLSSMEGNVTTAYRAAPSTCETGVVILDSGQPISGNLTGSQAVQFCVPARTITTLQFSVPPSLQNQTTTYTMISNSTAKIMASGENGTGGQVNGEMFLAAVPTRMPILLISPSGDDPVTIGVNNTGRGTALVEFQLAFGHQSLSSITTTSSTSNTSSATYTTTATPTTSEQTAQTGGGSTVSTTTNGGVASTTPETSSITATISHSANSTTTSTGSSSSTSSNGGGGAIPDFPYQLVAVAAFTSVVVVSYVLSRSRFGRRK
jgi:hypothetical protein